MDKISKLDNQLLANRNVLIIDSDPNLRSVLSRQLEYWKFTPKAEPDADSAYEMLVKNKFWPVMVFQRFEPSPQDTEEDTFRILDFILKFQPQNEYCVFFVLMEKGQEELAKTALDRGAHEIVEKPLRDTNLLESKVKTNARNLAFLYALEDRKRQMIDFYQTFYEINLQCNNSLQFLKETQKAGTISQEDIENVFEILEGISSRTDQYAKRHNELLEEQRKKEALTKAIMEQQFRQLEKDRKLRILLVEDNDSLRTLTKKMLSKIGSCEEAVNGLEAVKLFERKLNTPEQFDLVLMDIMMPEMNGRQALRRMRELEAKNNMERGKSTVITLVSTLDDRDFMVDTHAEGCNHYFVKPLTLERMKKFIGRTWGKKILGNE